MLGEITKVEIEVTVPEAAVVLSMEGLQAVTAKDDGDCYGGTLYLSIQDARRLREQLDEVISALELPGRQP